jgi:hypothetical protein
VTPENEPASTPEWGEFYKSSYSLNGGCVEIARSSRGDVLLRDSKDLDGPRLSFTRREWVAFLSGVRDGEFDPLAR